MEQPGAVERAEGHLGRADGPHLHQNRKPLHAQRRAAQHTGEPAAFRSQVTTRADLQKHRAESACTGGQCFPRSCGQHPEKQDETAELEVGLGRLRDDAVQPERLRSGRDSGVHH